MLSKLGCSVAFGGRNKVELDNVAAKCKETRSDAQVNNNVVGKLSVISLLCELISKGVHRKKALSDF